MRQRTRSSAGWKVALGRGMTRSVRRLEHTLDALMPSIPLPSEDPFYRAGLAVPFRTIGRFATAGAPFQRSRIHDANHPSVDPGGTVLRLAIGNARTSSGITGQTALSSHSSCPNSATSRIRTRRMRGYWSSAEAR